MIFFLTHGNIEHIVFYKKSLKQKKLCVLCSYVLNKKSC
jgi:hypothetical protein